MTTPVVMPQMGESLSEGTVIKWHKKPGDKVERDEPLFEISTDKVDTEVPSPVTGIVQRILVREGETVAVGTTVAEIAGAAETETETGAAPATASKPASEPTTAESSGGGHFRSSHEPMTFHRRTETSPPPSAPLPPPPAPPGEDKARRHHLSPAVVSFAAEHRLPIEELLSIAGSGAGGRITKRDVERYIETRETRETRESSPPPAPVSSITTRGSDPATLASRDVPPQYLYQPEPEDRLVPMSNMRKQIAEHMLWSQQLSAQVTSFTECNMHRIVRYRDEMRADFEEREGVPLSFLPFVAQSTVRALKQFPIFNASVVGDQIALKRHVHLGIAVALEQGLIVPVVRDADGMSFVGLARAIHGLAEKARGQGLEPADVRGATFTITNPGMFGGLTGTPMIAQPQVAILGLGAVTKKPVVVDDAIAIRPIMVLALTFDHRVIDGATGFQFLERIRLDLENFDVPDLPVR
jgi:pyruvate dehydrogenase E2 component (dihydrolipoyllysine-residue acetyltransferase)